MCVGSAGSRADGRAGRRGSRQSRTGAWRRRGARACSDRARSTSHRAATWRSCGSWSEAPAWCAVALARSQVRFDAADRSRKSRKSPLGSEFCGDIPFTLWLFSEKPDQKGPGFLRSEAMLRGELQTEAKRTGLAAKWWSRVSAEPQSECPHARRSSVDKRAGKSTVARLRQPIAFFILVEEADDEQTNRSRHLQMNRQRHCAD